MDHYDLCIAWNWEHDADFVALLEAACRQRNLSLLQITPANLVAVESAVQGGEIAFGSLLDRACDADPRFVPLVQWASQHGIRSVNPLEKAQLAWDKTTMHLEFLTAGVHVPDAIILPSFREQADLSSLDIRQLGPSFTIKPACRGGGEGVVNEASSLIEVLEARQKFPDDRYLLQAQIVPAQYGCRSAWFRVIYCAGQVYACWWDIRTHAYEPVQGGEQTERAFEQLDDITRTIAEVCKLGLFSTEIALTQQGEIIVVDYVNDPLDLRLQSTAADGVPDSIVAAIAERLADTISQRCDLS